jgi:hypothetical protein
VASSAVQAVPANIVQYTATPVQAQIVEKETLPEMAERIAQEYSIDSKTLFNLIESESQWNPEAKNGDDRGLVQINSKYWPEISDEEAYDPEFALNFAAKEIKKNQGIHWTSCNCVAFIRTMGVHFPRLEDAKDLDTNSLVPIVGGVVKLVYNGIYHLAYIEKITAEGLYLRESNYKPCLIARRLIPLNDPHIIGYYSDVD